MHVSFLADPLKPTHNRILNAHHNHLCGIFEIRKTFRFRRQKYSPHCNSVQRESCAPPEGRSLTDALREMERRISLSFLRASAIPLSGVSFLHTFSDKPEKSMPPEAFSLYDKESGVEPQIYGISSSTGGLSGVPSFMACHCSRVISIWRGFEPSNGPTIPFSSSSSMILAARA